MGHWQACSLAGWLLFLSLKIIGQPLLTRQSSALYHLLNGEFLLCAFLCVFASLRENYLAAGLSRILLAQRRKDAKKGRKEEQE